MSNIIAKERLMSTSEIGRIERIMHFCAAADPEVISRPDTPALDRIKHSAIGGMVMIGVLLGGLGWYKKVGLMFAGSTMQTMAAVLGGLLMAALIFCIERVALATVSRARNVGGKALAFSGRATIGALNALLLVLPWVLTYFDGQIAGHLDDQKLQQMTEKRAKVGDLFNVGALTIDLNEIQRKQAINLQRQNQLPPHIQSLISESLECDRKLHSLRESLETKISAASMERQRLLRDLKARSGDESSLRTISAQIEGWQRTLAEKSAACKTIANRASLARERYLSALEREAQVLNKRKAEAESALDAAKGSAKQTLEQSDRAVAARTRPDLRAQAAALYDLARTDEFVRIAVLIAYLFFLSIEILPVAFKMAGTGIYERRVQARDEVLEASLDAETESAKTTAMIARLQAIAERVGAERFHREHAVEVHLEAARQDAINKARKAELIVPFEDVQLAVDAYWKAVLAFDNLNRNLRDNQVHAGELERLRALLDTVLRKVSSELNTRYAPA